MHFTDWNNYISSLSGFVKQYWFDLWNRLKQWMRPSVELVVQSFKSAVSNVITVNGLNPGVSVVHLGKSWKGLLLVTLVGRTCSCHILFRLNPFTPKSAAWSSKWRKTSWISFCKIAKNKQHHMKVLLNSFHLNGHILGFHPQTKKVQPHLLTRGLTLGVKP